MDDLISQLLDLHGQLKAWGEDTAADIAWEARRVIEAWIAAPKTPEMLSDHLRVAAVFRDGEPNSDADLMRQAADALDRLSRLDRESATYVESVIVMRTGFTGDPPYVGWKGLGLALNEALDELDQLRKA